MIFRILFLAAAVYVVYRVALVILAKMQGRSVAPPPEKPYLPMAQCAKCGAHVPPDTLSPKGFCGRCAETP